MDKYQEEKLNFMSEKGCVVAQMPQGAILFGGERFSPSSGHEEHEERSGTPRGADERRVIFRGVSTIIPYKFAIRWTPPFFLSLRRTRGDVKGSISFGADELSFSL